MTNKPKDEQAQGRTELGSSYKDCLYHCVSRML